MKALTYISSGRFAVTEKTKPVVNHGKDAVVKITLSSICSSDLHIKHGSVPRAVPGITVGHEMVGVVESVGQEVKKVRPGDRVAVNVETFCGECGTLQGKTLGGAGTQTHSGGKQALYRGRHGFVWGDGNHEGLRERTGDEA